MRDVWAYIEANPGVCSFILALLIALVGLGRHYLKTYDIEKRYHEKCRECEDEQEKNAKLNTVIRELTSVAIFNHWLYVLSDPVERRPICHVCHARGEDIRMRFLPIVDIKTDKLLGAHYYCDGCKREYSIGANELVELKERLRSDASQSVHKRLART